MTHSNLNTIVKTAGILAFTGAMALAMGACWELDSETEVEGNFAITYNDIVRVYFNDELVAEIDAAEGGEIPLGELGTFEYDELCSSEDVVCPSEQFWDEVAVEQPLGTDNALLNAVNIGTYGEEGTRLAGLIEANGDYALLLGISAASAGSCLAVGVSVAEGSFTHAFVPNERNPVYDRIEDGVITVAYGAGCYITEDIILTGSLSFETDFTGVRTGDLDYEEVEAEPAIDEDGEEIPEEQVVE